MTYYIHAAEFFLKDKIELDSCLEITDDGKFGFYCPENEKPNGEIKEYPDKVVAPGYVDTHVHGLLNEDVMKSDWQGISKISKGLLAAGVTSWSPTAIITSDETLTNIYKIFTDHKNQETGAKIQGIYLEGPFFTPEYGGVENPKYVVDLNIKLFGGWCRASDNMLIKILMAPEYKGGCEFIRETVKEGVTVSLGHSSSNFKDTNRTINAGASMFTHTYNRMNHLSQHEPNIIGAAFASRLADCELIADGHHVGILALRALIQAKGCEHICLVTDCMQAGMISGDNYMLDELSVYVKNGMAHLVNNNNLAGNILLLKDAVKNLVDWDIISRKDAVMMANYVPAKSSKILDKYGVIASGRAADFLILNNDMTLVEAYLDGVSRCKIER